MMKRREFVTLVGGAAVAWPLRVRAQQSAVPVIGFLRNTFAAPFAHLVTELGKGLSEEGFVEGRNVIIEQRWGDNQPDRLPSLAADLVRRKAAVIVGNTPGVLAAVRVAGPTKRGRAARRSDVTGWTEVFRRRPRDGARRDAAACRRRARERRDPLLRCDVEGAGRQHRVRGG